MSAGVSGSRQGFTAKKLSDVVARSAIVGLYADQVYEVSGLLSSLKIAVSEYHLCTPPYGGRGISSVPPSQNYTWAKAASSSLQNCEIVRLARKLLALPC